MTFFFDCLVYYTGKCSAGLQWINIMADFESVKAQHKGFLTLLSSYYNTVYKMKQLSN